MASISVLSVNPASRLCFAYDLHFHRIETEANHTASHACENFDIISVTVH
jgi:hypothetical protein